MKFFRYRLPFKKPFRTSTESYSYREGFMIQCNYLAFSCYGDVAPLPGFSQETISQVQDQIKQFQNTFDRYFMQDKGYSDWNSFANSLNLYPSLRFGLDTFLFDRISKKRGLPLNKHFSAHSNDSLPVNITIGLNDLETTIQYCKTAWSEGFRNFKIKVGKDFQLESTIIKEIRKTFPKSNIRIDPNEGWDVDEAVKNLNTLTPLNIEFCEQPVDCKNEDGLDYVHQESQIPIAADEAARDSESISRLIRHKTVDILILKPMLIGSYDDIFQFTKEAKANNIETVFTTSLESGVGRLATAHLASLLGSTFYAHGLATGRFLKNDILKDDCCLSQGYYNLPDNRGIGLEPVMESSNILKHGISQ